MTGHVIKLGKGAKVKGGKIVIKKYYPNASAAIRAKSSKRQRVVRRTP